MKLAGIIGPEGASCCTAEIMIINTKNKKEL